MKKYKSWEEYIEDQTPRGVEMLEELKELIINTLPYAEQTMGYGVPAFNMVPNAKLENKIMVAAFKNHVSFYPHKDTIKHFLPDLSEFKVLEGTIQIKYSQDIPTELFKKMLLHRYEVIIKK